MTKKLFKKEYSTPLTEACGSEIADLLCQSALDDTSNEGYVEDDVFNW
ncbi:MAG: hypothetical protein J6S97_01810 [Bacteroidales bacterium]|nr:hypothetical protein [Bacteroidales bacterium]MBP5522237.1 hypothetical protein [Bacteroidales bacterium]